MRGESGQALGYTFRYLGLTKGGGVEGDRDHLRFEVTRGSDRMLVRLPYYMATMPDGQKQLIRNPSIRKAQVHPQARGRLSANISTLRLTYFF